MFRKLRFCAALFISTGLVSTLGVAQENGHLQIHYIDVGQGDGALLISPKGETVLFDSGLGGQSDRPISYLEQLGVNHIDYHIASHFHNDHIGCVPEVFSEFPLMKLAFDRGGTYDSKIFDKYVATFGSKRKQAVIGSSITLDKGSNAPVKIEFVAANGNGIQTSNENDLSLVSVVRFGKFDAVFAGDLSGADAMEYADIETSVAPKIGQVEVYKVNHHGSRYSSNETWMKIVHPKVAVISCGDGNVYKHPTAVCLQRLHKGGVERVYWTEKGNGAEPKDNQDKIAGNTIVEVEPGSSTFTVTYSGDQIDKYDDWSTAPAPGGSPGASGITTKYAWSKKAKTYHDPNCPFVKNISPANLETGDAPPNDKAPHTCVK